MQRHLADGVGRATQAGVVTADAVLNAVEHRLGNFGAVNIMFRDLRHGAVHGQVVLAGGDDEIDLLSGCRRGPRCNRGKACRAGPRSRPRREGC